MQHMIDLFFVVGARYVFLLSVIIAGVYFLKQPRSVQKRILIFACITLPLTFVIARVGGHFYDNPRPFVVGNFTPLIPHAPDNGFPSDHTLLVSAIASLVYAFNRRSGLVLWLIALYVAVSRVYVGVHHPIDVIGSMVIASLVTAFAVFFITFVQEKFLVDPTKR